ncbi:triphosphoribosyl-dephospho-CoA synthase [Candidatus Borrarchaeum sp.]|uniref:triphosphoribosyl-dephospho-CoA synthase n=1 Tax=Candidatus Borrarchaeum sp. TaxID=2846742 RepID=UPI002580921A|nr:triphosphoribosyl-dephospho-CoA synthase [Candidatus Borrarchaeum sp.]
MQKETWVNKIQCCAQLAAALELSGWPKPGNVHRTADFADTRYEHYLAGAVAIGPAIARAASQGVKLQKGEIQTSDVGIGRWILQGIRDVKQWNEPNTNLGMLILMVPLATAAGTLIEKREFEIELLRKQFNHIVRATTPQDALDLYQAIATVSPGGMGKVDDEADVTDENTWNILKEREITLFRTMEISQEWDTISKEFVTALELSLGKGYPFFRQTYVSTKDVNITTVHTFLFLLSSKPDTLIQRKLGNEAAMQVSYKAKEVLEMGGLLTQKGTDALHHFDRSLRDSENRYNPGTTADLISVILMVNLMQGMKII